MSILLSVLILFLASPTKASEPTMAFQQEGDRWVATIPLKLWQSEEAKHSKEAWFKIVSTAEKCLNSAVGPGLNIRLQPRGIFFAEPEQIRNLMRNQRKTGDEFAEVPRFLANESRWLNVVLTNEFGGLEDEDTLGGTLPFFYRELPGEKKRYMGPRDLMLSPSASGAVLAHEILHSWGGLQDRYSRLGGVIHTPKAYVGNLMAAEGASGCSITPEQRAYMIEHANGGWGEPEL